MILALNFNVKFFKSCRNIKLNYKKINGDLMKSIELLGDPLKRTIRSN